ncbi:MAG TPA: glycoside hydrolase family 38 C-terminal domain-containing protein [Vicinamibacterales bacterium]|nr:glycoside hydrolase family 38 C-terminal domain-containing protein [Vicinamibacterales bacterium]
MRSRLTLLTTLAACLVSLATLSSQVPASKTIYVVSTAHLDSQWNWTVQDTIRDFVPKTFYTNFELFEKYPNYIFNWEGAIHYMWFKEYFPDDWTRVQKYVADGRWRVSGSWINAVDVNMPSPESLFRHALYGQRFFREEFKKVSRDIYLPDCFGFPFSLPAIARASGLNSFSTQKLTWGRPIPFPVGRWKGVDGSEILANLDPKSYTSRITGNTDITIDPAWTSEFTSLGDGKAVEFRYVGTGDTGGAPTEETVQNLQKAMTKADAPVKVLNTSADQLAKDLTPEQFAALPAYNSELILKTHGTGCYTSQAAMKKFNRQNELLADAAERSAVAAQWLTGLPYPGDRLRESWTRVLWHQFHDDLTGTCIPQAYQFSWNDELASLNQFAGVLTSSTSAVAQVLDTRGAGIPLVVFNPISSSRRDPVEATVRFAGPAPASIAVTDAATGREVLTQVLERSGSEARVLFLPELPSVGFKVFHARTRANEAVSGASSLNVTQTTLENNRLTVTIDRNGDVASIYDKDAKHELLSAPVMLELRDNLSPPWPAWEVLYDTVQGAAREYVSRPTIRIVERGPVRVSLEITRRAAGSTFVQRVRVTEGGDRVDIDNVVDWKSPNSLLKASFPLAAANGKATYDLGVGTIERTNNEPDKYEVPAQKWADVTDASGRFGVGIINDSKHGWDKPNDNTLRLTLIHTPRPVGSYTYQSSNDLGRHQFLFSIAGHQGDWRQGRMPHRATQVNQPPVAFQADAHPGPLGKSFSMIGLDDQSGQVAVVALKKAEDGDELVVRLQERYGTPARTNVRLPGGVVAVREINAAEEEVGPFVQPQQGRGNQPAQPRPLLANVELKPYQPRTLAFRLAPAVAGANATMFAAGRGNAAAQGQTPAPPQPIAVVERVSSPVTLPFNLDGVTTDKDRADGDFDGRQRTLAAELLPKQLTINGIRFEFGSGAAGAKNVLVPKGERLALPDGSFNRVYVIAAAVGADVPLSIGFTPSAAPVSRNIVVREWQGPVGQWWSRLKEPDALREPFVPQRAGQGGTPTQQEIQAGLVVSWDPQTGDVRGIENIRPGFVKRDEIAWIGTHRHAPNGNQIYVASYLFMYPIDLPPGARTLVLPTNDRVRILAITAVREPAAARPATLLYAADLPTK